MLMPTELRVLPLGSSRIVLKIFAWRLRASESPTRGPPVLASTLYMELAAMCDSALFTASTMAFTCAVWPAESGVTFRVIGLDSSACSELGRASCRERVCQYV